MLSILSCTKFDFVSQDEDANGMYLELIASYQLEGNEIVYKDDWLYLLDHGYNTSKISCYDCWRDTIVLYTSYETDYHINDFSVNVPYVYVVSDLGFEIISVYYGFVYSAMNISPASFISICDNRAYVACGSVLYIIDITEPRDPEIEGIMNFSETIQGLAVDTIFAFVHAGQYTLYTVNVQNPANPVLTATLNLPGSGPYSLHMQHGCLYAFNEYDDFILIYTIEPDGLNRNYSSLSLPNVYYAYIGDEYGLVFRSHELLLVDMQYTPVLAVCERMHLLEPPQSGAIDAETIYLLTNSHLLVVKIRTDL